MTFKERLQSWKSMSVYLFGKTVFELQNNGIRGVLRGIKRYRSIKKHLSPDRQRVVLHGQTEYQQFDFVLQYNPHNAEHTFTPQELDSTTPLTINWVIPDIKIGSGGHTTLFRLMYLLEEKGHSNRVYVYNKPLPLPYSSGKEIRDIVQKHFFPLKAEFFLGADPKTVEDSDVLVATSWHTAYPVYAINNTKKKCYLVQDFEPAFHAMNSEYTFAEATYRMGYSAICAGPWLAKKMKNYGASATQFQLAYDRDVYRPLPDIQRKKKQVAFYARFVTERRGFELGILALELVQQLRPDIDIVLFGWDCSNQDIPFEYTNGGVMTPVELAQLYNESTVGLVFSLTNYSLIPQEMMACSLPVLEYKGENTTAVYDGSDIIALADPNPHSVAMQIIELIDNADRREKQAHKAREWVSQFTWEEAATIVENAFYEL